MKEVEFGRDKVLEILGETGEFWQTQTLEDVHRGMVGVTDIPVNIGEYENVIQAHILRPRTNDIDDREWIVRLAEHQQPYQEMQHIGASVTRDLIAPNSNVIMFQNNSFLNNVHPIGKKRSAENLRDWVAAEQVQALKKIGVQAIIVSGYSLGGLSAFHLAKMAAKHDLEVMHVNSDEAPSKAGRTAKELEKDFIKSGGWFKQRQSMAESGIPAVAELAKAQRLGPDYIKFGLASKLMKHNRLAHKSMAGSMNDVVAEAMHETKDMDTTYKVGFVQDSKLFDPDSITDALARDDISRAQVARYFGNLCHGHTTVNNPLVQAAMVADGHSHR